MSDPSGSARPLTSAEAAGRAARVEGVRYALRLELRAGAEVYQGELEATFTVRPGDEPLWLDWTGGELLAQELDGRDAALRREGARLHLPELPPGLHQVRLRYRSRFDTTGTGFHRFLDPEDAGEYLYTDFQPFNAHRLFPCFDQPDLKARYAVTVAAPARWEVISAGPLLERTSLPDERACWRFAETPPFSSYLLAVIAGDYACFEAAAGEVPLRFLCRRSLARHLELEDLVRVTADGLRFFSAAFATPYPFQKYDQAFVPEFNAGAMENVAAVTLGEHLIFRGQASPGERLNRAETLLHELAHMWFGNLVTMRWWDDLWLNESFATYASYLALADSGRFPGCWEHFRARIKDWAHRQDELPTRHPIAGEVPDTDATFLNFDGITYGKGAAALRQLHCALGDQAFYAGLRRYFTRFAWQSTTLADFLHALEEGSELDLSAWAAAWLRTSGASTLRPELELAGDRIASLTVLQEPPPGAGPLPHRLRLGLFRRAPDGGLILSDQAEVQLVGTATPVPALRGAAAPDYLTLDLGDRTYARLVLDERSLAGAELAASGLREPLDRLQLWGCLWTMVRDQRLPAGHFLERVARLAAGEEHCDVLEPLLEQARLALSLYLPPAEAERRQPALWRATRDRLAAPGGDAQRLLWLRHAVGIARREEDFDELLAWSDGAAGAPGLVLDQPLRWDVVVRAMAWGHPRARARLELERRRDGSDKGRKAAWGAEVSAPDPAAKAAAWSAFVGEAAGLSDDFLKAGMARFHWPHQAALLRPYTEAFFREVRVVAARGEQEYTHSFFRCLFPPYPEEGVLARARSFLASEPPPTLRRLGQEALSELERAAACRALSAADGVHA